MLSVLSLFSGAGGMDVGLERAGFHHVGLIEIGQRQRQTLELNNVGQLLGDGDVNGLAKVLEPRALGLAPGELDLMAGGPPCQPFSMAAQWAARGRQGMLDPRAETVVSTLSLVRKFLPRAVLFENVKGFVQGPRAAIGYLKNEFANINAETGVRYQLYVQMINAADFGVPQNRQRAIVVAIRDGVEFAWPAPTHAERPLTAWDALWDVDIETRPQNRGKWAELLPLIPEGSNYLWLTSRGQGPELFGYRTKYWNFLLKLARDRPSWTLPASPGPSTGPFHWENRPLAVEEQLRLQSFPDGWSVAGNYREQTLQIGNATPPLLAEILGQAIKRCLTRKPGEKPSLIRVPAGKVPAPRETETAVPLRYAGLVGAKDAHAGEGKGPAARSLSTVNSESDVSLPAR
ncbi:DNA cytosine methyltransferase [Microbacterium sp. NPDC056052]|uniref:DNA cytosine methyltransferase n=1 Tax=Microbacterium sp. NPDC056052 TaxID=3345695 RepID=UPI0035E3283C